MTSKVETTGSSSADVEHGSGSAPQEVLRHPEPASGVIPTSQVVILKEQDLDCDLATAIRRVRSSAETARARILVVAPDDAEAHDVGDGEPRELPLPSAPTTLSQVVRCAEQAASARFGARLEPLGACFERFLEEARWALEDIRRDPRGDGARVLGEVLDWTGAVAEDLRTEARLAASGFQPTETRELVLEMGRQVEAHFPGLRVSVAPVEGSSTCWARPAELAEAFFLALVLAAHRIGGRGAVIVEITEIGEEAAEVDHRFVGHGEPSEVHAPQVAARLRAIVHRHDGRISPDRFGPHGTGFSLRLPSV